MWKIWPKYFFSFDLNKKNFGYKSEDFKKKNFLHLGKKRMLRFLTETPLSANLFPLESSFQKHPWPGGGASGGGCRRAKPPTKIRWKKKFDIFHRIFFVLKCKKKILKSSNSYRNGKKCWSHYFTIFGNNVTKKNPLYIHFFFRTFHECCGRLFLRVAGRGGRGEEMQIINQE